MDAARSTRSINHEAGQYGAIGYVNDWQTGPKRELLEEHRARIREQIEGLRAWLRAQGLPEHGRGVVIGESSEERARRLGAGA